MSPHHKIAQQKHEKFVSLQLSIVNLLTEHETKSDWDFKAILFLIKTLLEWMENNIYLSKEYVTDSNLFRQAFTVIHDYFTKTPVQADDIIDFLYAVSENNIVQRYDYGWLYEEKHVVYKSLIMELLGKLQSMLEPSSSYIGFQELAKLSFLLSVWDFPPSPSLIELVLQHLEKSIMREERINANDSFLFIKGMTWPYTECLQHNNPIRAECFAKLAKKALPLLLQDESPLRLFKSQSINLSRVAILLRLIPQLELRHNQQIFQAAINSLRANGKPSSQSIDLYEYLPKEIVPHRTLLIALEKKKDKLFEEVFAENNSISETQKRYIDKEGNIKFHSELDSYPYFLSLLEKDFHPRGMQWYISKYSQCLLASLNSGMVTYAAKGISTYLKTLRRYLLEAEPAIKEVVFRLCKEAIDEINFKDINYALAIELLWINLVLTKVLQAPESAYSPEEQAKLFRQIQDCTINAEQARALLAIRTCKWHGGVAFDKQLNRQITEHMKSFAQGANPSQDEFQWYQFIESLLSTEGKNALKANLICKFTGQEIDIAIVAPHKRIAIHIDGPAHYHTVAGQPSFPTLFRNYCLKEAGWISRSIHLVDGIDRSEKEEQVRQWLVSTLSPLFLTMAERPLPYLSGNSQHFLNHLAGRDQNTKLASDSSTHSRRG